MRLQYTVELEVSENRENFQEIEKKIKNGFMSGAQEMAKEVLLEIENQWLKRHKGYRNKGKKDGTFKTSFGEFELKRQRVKYRGKSFYIIDNWMNLCPYTRSTEVFEEIEKNSFIENSFRKGNKIVERITGTQSTAMAAWRRFQKAAEKEKYPSPVLLPCVPVKRLPDKAENACPILCIEADGTYCKNQDQEGKNHEIKIAVLYTGKTYYGKKYPKAELQNKTIVTSLKDEAVQSFLGRVAWVATNKYKVNNKTVIIVRGDGDPWIKKIKYDYFPQAKYFLDWWHVKKNMALAFGKEATAIMMEYVYSRNPAGLLQHLRKVYLSNIHTLGEKTLDAYRGFYYYIENNKEGLEFSHIPPEFKKLHPGMFKRGSGVIERNVDLVVGERCKLKRMSWSKNGLDNMIYLRQNMFNKAA